MQELLQNIFSGSVGAILGAVIAVIAMRKTNAANKRLHEEDIRTSLCTDIAKMVGEYSVAVRTYHANKVHGYAIEKELHKVSFNPPFDKRMVKIYQDQRDAITLNRDGIDSLASIITFRLHGIESAKPLLDRLTNIHENSSEDVLLGSAEFDKQIADLTNKTTEFIDAYKSVNK